jgi:hypothetical protein
VLHFTFDAATFKTWPLFQEVATNNFYLRRLSFFTAPIVHFDLREFAFLEEPAVPKQWICRGRGNH